MQIVCIVYVCEHIYTLHTHTFTRGTLRTYLKLIKSNQSTCKVKAQNTTPNIQPAVTTQLVLYADPQLSISVLWDRTVKREWFKTVGLQRTLRTDGFIINSSLPRKLQPGYTQNIPFNSLSSAFPYLPLTCSKANLLSDSRSTVVCYGRGAIERVSAMKIKRKRMTEG